MREATRKELQWMHLCLAGGPIFSTCSRRQYFAVILTADGRTAGTGYNGPPSGFTHCMDGGCPRAQSEAAHGSSYGLTCLALHAEANALMYSDRSDRKGGTLIINGPPCADCAKLIAGSGLSTLVFLEDPTYINQVEIMGFLAQAGIDVARVAISTVGSIL